MSFDVECAKEEYLRWRRQEWREAWRDKNYRELQYRSPSDIPDSKVPEPPSKEIEPTAWASSDWGTGGVVIDMQVLSALPEARQKAIFKQISLFCKRSK